MIPLTNTKKMNYYIRTKTVMFSNYKNEIYNTSIISSSNTLTELKTPHEDGNFIYFILTLFIYLIKSKGQKYTIKNNTTI